MKEKILIIDDEPDILALLASILEHEGYEVLTAADGVAGMERFREGKPDLVITDVKMPQKDGLNVLREIKKVGADVDTIILTGHSDEATAIDCLRTGAYDYLLKPLEDIEVLLVSIQHALYKRTLERKNKQLIRQLEEMTIKDPLTDLSNFRQLHICLDEEIARSGKYHHSFCGVMLEIDHFKAVNETYGHLFGDYVLERLAEIMRQHLRTVDRIFRYGGATFFIIMPETDQDKAAVAVNRIMTAVRNYHFMCDDQQTNITLSIGGAMYPDQAQEKTALLRDAEKALDHAQKMGGDQVIFRV